METFSGNTVTSESRRRFRLLLALVCLIAYITCYNFVRTIERYDAGYMMYPFEVRDGGPPVWAQHYSHHSWLNKTCYWVFWPLAQIDCSISTRYVFYDLADVDGEYFDWAKENIYWDETDVDFETGAP